MNFFFFIVRVIFFPRITQRVARRPHPLPPLIQSENKYTLCDVAPALNNFNVLLLEFALNAKLNVSKFSK